MKIEKQNKIVYKIVRTCLGTCPLCKTATYDKRHKEKVPIDSCNIYRTSDTSVTMQCKQCGIHFTVTWKSLAQSIAARADNIAHEESKAHSYYWLVSAYQALEKYVNIEGIRRG